MTTPGSIPAAPQRSGNAAARFGMWAVIPLSSVVVADTSRRAQLGKNVPRTRLQQSSPTLSSSHMTHNASHSAAHVTR